MSDRASYGPGDAIRLSLANHSAASYGSVASCATPMAVWFRSSEGLTYFSTSGVHLSCEDGRAPISPGSSAALATIDSGLVWVARSSDDQVFRLPKSLPGGRYPGHALTSRGEVVTAVEITE